MKTRITKKELKHNYKIIISTGLDVSYLFYECGPDFYYSNMYGWRFDAYKLNNDIILTTGYEFLKENKNQEKIDEIIRLHNRIAKALIERNKELKYEYDVLRQALNFNLNDLIKEISEVINNE